MLNERIIEVKGKYLNFINNKQFPCIGAKAALAKEQVSCMVARNMACPADDIAILNFLYGFIDGYLVSQDHFHSAAVIFDGPGIMSEAIFETLLWQRLQAISNLDALHFRHDKRVSADPASPGFGFSIKEEALFILGMHPFSSRAARRFEFPTLIFNPHAQFEELKKNHTYKKMQYTVRKRDLVFSGSVNPMLSDHGELPETLQYSGKNYIEPLQCPLKINHAKN